MAYLLNVNIKYFFIVYLLLRIINLLILSKAEICQTNIGNIYLLSLLREVKGSKISDIQNNTNESKRVLVTDITVPSLRGTVISVTSTSLDEFVLFCMSEILSSHDFP